MTHQKQLPRRTVLVLGGDGNGGPRVEAVSGRLNRAYYIVELHIMGNSTIVGSPGVQILVSADNDTTFALGLMGTSVFMPQSSPQGWQSVRADSIFDVINMRHFVPAGSYIKLVNTQASGTRETAWLVLEEVCDDDVG